MKHCVIVASHKGFKQLVLLIDLMKYADFYIHIDRKSELLYENMKNWIKETRKSNVFLVEERVDVKWSAFSQVEATLRLMKMVVNSNKRYDYVHFISGQDFPIKTKEEIEEIICSFKNENSCLPNFIECNEIGNHKWRIKQFSFFRESKYNRTILFRIIDNLVRSLQKNILCIERKNLENMKLYIGSSWWSLTLDCVKYICSSIDDGKFIDDFRYTCCPDEHFFQIIIMNSIYKNSVINNNLRYINFTCGNSSPDYILNNDVENVLNSKKIFARKFDENVDSLAIEKVIERISIR